MVSLLVQTSFIGDAILTTPLVAELAARGPVDVLVTPSGAAVLQGNPHVRRLIVYDKRGKDKGPAGLLRIARSARSSGHDATAYLAQGSLRSALLARLAGYKQRVGFDTSAGRLLYTRLIPLQREQHHAERLLRLALGADAEVPRRALRPRVYPSDADRDAVDRLLGTVHNEGRSLIALAPGSVWATKRWPYYAELAAALQATHRSIVVGSRDDAPLTAEIVRATGGDAIDAAGRLTLLGSAELIGRCRAIVTNDSAPLHLASAMNTPTVAIFGPTVPAFGFGPLAETSTIAEHMTLACRPCHPHGPMVCPLGHWRCMRDLSLETVLARVTALT
ncbi:MAG TPA: lipopolysaccharide heptosyltransferase II [Gemmatimonadaceae bacterium]|nr:lipopolysaccharide heptosyltransferase II [Gemmatimonadaceae bacterium]